MSKGLDLIQRQQPEIIDGFPTGNIYIGVTEEELAELEEELKALEIIKTVCPNIFWVMRTYTYEEYKKKCSDDALLREEYDSLKEVLL